MANFIKVHGEKGATNYVNIDNINYVYHGTDNTLRIHTSSEGGVYISDKDDVRRVLEAIGH